MGRKKQHTPKSNTFTVQGTDPGLGFSPYQRDKGMAYTPDPKKDGKRNARRSYKQKLRKGDHD